MAAPPISAPRIVNWPGDVATTSIESSLLVAVKPSPKLSPLGCSSTNVCVPPRAVRNGGAARLRLVARNPFGVASAQSSSSGQPCWARTPKSASSSCGNDTKSSHPANAARNASTSAARCRVVNSEQLARLRQSSLLCRLIISLSFHFDMPKAMQNSGIANLCRLLCGCACQIPVDLEVMGSH